MLPSADLTERAVAFFVPAIVPVAAVSVVRESAGVIKLVGASSGTSAAKSIFARAISRSLSAAAIRSAKASFFLGAGEALMGVVASVKGSVLNVSIQSKLLCQTDETARPLVTGTANPARDRPVHVTSFPQMSIRSRTPPAAGRRPTRTVLIFF